jgi:hypothetical protein
MDALLSLPTWWADEDPAVAAQGRGRGWW